MNSLFRSFALVALLRRATGANRSLMLASNSFFSSCFSPFYALNKRALGLEFELWFFVRIARFLEWFALVALYKKSEKNDSLFEKSEALFRSRKTSDLHKKPKSKFPSLLELGLTNTGWVKLDFPPKKISAKQEYSTDFFHNLWGSCRPEPTGS